MLCPSCQEPNEEGEEVCFNCRAVLSAITAGTVIGGRYEVVRKLGRGGMGTVYKARDRELDEDVALKILRADLAHADEVAKRFRSEIKLARRVGHRNVCRIFEYGQDGPIRFISMELIEGMDLKQLLRKRGSLPWTEAFDVAIQTTSGLGAIHELGIVHRDLKTTNVMLDSRGVVRLMDFGIAKRFESDTTGATATGHIVGTPEYMSPEQAQAHRVDARSDIYSLGIMIFEVFTGSVPFRGDTPVATLMMHLNEPPPLQGPEAARLPPSLVPLLERALAKAASNRHSSAAELAEDLRRSAADAGVEAQIPGATFVPVYRPPTPTPIPVSTSFESVTVLTSRDSLEKPTSAELAKPTALLPHRLRTLRPEAAGPKSRRRVAVAGSVAAAAIVFGFLAWSQRPTARSPFGVDRGSASASPPVLQSPLDVVPRPDLAIPPSTAAEASLTSPAPSSLAPGAPGPGPMRRRGEEMELRWTPSSGATGYRVTVAEDSAFRVIRLDRSVRTTSLGGLGFSPGRYYWRVAALHSTGEEGPPSRVNVFEVMATPRADPRLGSNLPSVPAPAVVNAPSPSPKAPPATVAAAPVPSPAAGTTAPPPRTESMPPSATPASTEQVAPSGVLSVVVVPFAEAIIDGKPAGRVSSKRFPLPAGSHVIVLEHPEYLPLRRKLEIGPGETVSLVVDMAEEAVRKKRP